MMLENPAGLEANLMCSMQTTWWMSFGRGKKTASSDVKKTTTSIDLPHNLGAFLAILQQNVVD